MRVTKTNIAEYLPEVAAEFANRRAVVMPVFRDRLGRVAYSHLTFSQLENLSNAYAREFRGNGVEKGKKVLVMVKPSLDFIAIVFAIFKTGAVPVLIDPGMGRNNLLNCVRDTAPDFLVAIPLVHWARLFYSSVFKSVTIAWSTGGIAPPGVKSLNSIGKSLESKMEFDIVKTAPTDMAAIVFTTGSTGPPKGVVYTHGIFIAQTEIIRDVYGAGPDEIDMPAFPLFALFSSALGMTCVIPDMNPSCPAKADPAKIVETILNQNISFSFASPALWRVVADYCLENDIVLPTLRKALMAGAPVPAGLHEKMKKIIAPDGETIVPYGATESLPIANFTGSEMLAETAAKTADGQGYCVGYPLPPVRIEVIKACDDAIETWTDSLLLSKGEIGEIVVNGPVVTPEYYQRTEQTRMAKIKHDDGSLWHRMGDMGRFDEKGRLWFLGRKAHRVINDETIFYPVCCEAIFNAHPDVFRTALVGTGTAGSQRPVIIVEPVKGKFPSTSEERERFILELRELGQKKDFTKAIDAFLFHPSFPVDIRHNAKIFREKLAVWATSQNEP